MGEREVLGKQSGTQAGLKFGRIFTEAGVSPYDTVEWEERTAQIANEKGEVIFEQTAVEVPQNWSQTATNIVASKYFHGKQGTPARETSVRQLIGRVADTITGWGDRGGIFTSEDDRDAFHDELTHMLLHQKVAFNSPVWFNVGTVPKPQCSACFIQSVRDDMTSIMDLAKTESMLFKFGSGTGSNFSQLRGSREHLSGGGIASGPVSFMRGFDAFAGVIKSGGKTRRAAKMVILDIDHPDIVEFIECKSREERKAWDLISLGYDPGIDGDAYGSVFFQNANHSVRVTDEFMQAVAEDRSWYTKTRTDGKPAEEYKARDLMAKVAESAYQCGDPGIQYDSTINRWHTCKKSGRINASNPCSEYMFLDDTACNLASFNLMRFVDGAGSFEVEAFRHGIDVVITAMEIIVDNASYPTGQITVNSHDYRPLGLGYANLGALLMARGIPYDSDEGRDIAAAITAVMTGQAYATSARIASTVGSFARYEENRESMLDVISMHRDAVRGINADNVAGDLMGAAQECWDEALERGQKNGYRNAQASVIAPTGTIAFMMDCDTTGIEPELALVKYKRLVGGGVIKIVNNTVPMALQRLDYQPEQISEIVGHIDEFGTIEAAPHLRDEHLTVFDCSLKPSAGQRIIHHMGHLRMMAAVQPFISGAISKTVNMPEESTVEEIGAVYAEGARLGLKAVAVYRDGSKKAQPLSTSAIKDRKAAGNQAGGELQRKRLPDTRQSLTHKFSVGGHDGYITVGLYENDKPGEVFITMAKEGSTLSGVMDSFALAISIALQYGVPLKTYVDKFQHVRFEPAGWTNNPEIPQAKSVIDYIFRWLGSQFISPSYKTVDLTQNEDVAPVQANANAGAAEASPQAPDHTKWGPVDSADAPMCSECGSLMTRNGSCYKCHNCGGTSGCS